VCVSSDNACTHACSRTATRLLHIIHTHSITRRWVCSPPRLHCNAHSVLPCACRSGRFFPGFMRAETNLKRWQSVHTPLKCAVDRIPMSMHSPGSARSDVACARHVVIATVCMSLLTTSTAASVYPQAPSPDCMLWGCDCQFLSDAFGLPTPVKFFQQFWTANSSEFRDMVSSQTTNKLINPRNIAHTCW
jgi:hypothetical protein